MSWRLRGCVHNCVKSRQARPLQRPRVVTAMVATLTGAGCVIPQGLEEQQLAVNHRPRIVRSSTRPVPEIEELFTVTPADPMPRFTIPVADDDLLDTLRIRMFLDYDPAVEEDYAVLASPERAPNEPPSLVRTFSFRVGGMCAAFDDTDHLLTGLVSDRPFLDNEEIDGGLANRVTTGLTDETFWRVRCSPATTPPDAGVF